MNSRTRWILTALSFLVLVGGSFVLHGMMTQEKLRLAQDRKALESSSQQVIQASALAIDLKDHQEELTSISSLLPTRDGVGLFVGALNTAAKQRGLTLTVPTINEEFAMDASGQPIPPEGPLTSVAVNVAVVGDPAALLQFLHVVETMPYVITLEKWDLQSGNAQTLAIHAVTAPQDGTASPASVPGYLQATVRIAIMQTTPSPLP